MEELKKKKEQGQRGEADGKESFVGLL